MRYIRAIAAILCLALSCTAEASSSSPALTQYGHTAWRLQDGAFSGTPNALAQTPDGYLWIGTQSGLLRFDGVRFAAVASQEPLSVKALLAGPDGTLWIGTTQGLLSLRHGQLQRTADTGGHYINAITQTSAGAIWFTQSRVPKDKGTLCNVTDITLKCFGAETGLKPLDSGALAADREGNLWVDQGRSVRRWNGLVTGTFVPKGMRLEETTGVLKAILPREDGTILIGASIKGSGMGFQRLLNEKWSGAVTPGLDSSQLAVSVLMAERDNAIWIGTEDEGLVHVHDRKADRFTESDGLSGNSVTALLQDRDGNVWVATTRGLDCFRKLRVVSYSLRQGMPADYAYSVTASKGGGVWIGSRGLVSLREREFASITRSNGFPGARATAVLEQSSGAIWVGVDGELFRYSSGRFEKFQHEREVIHASILNVVEDTDHTVWALSAGRPYRLYRVDLKTRRLVQVSTPTSREVSALAAHSEGGLIVGTRAGEILRFQHGNWNTEVPAIGILIRSFLTYADGSLGATSPSGIFVWKDHRGRLIDKTAGLPCNEIYSAVLDQDENTWAYASCGLIRINKSDLNSWFGSSSGLIASRVFDAFDGALASDTPFSPAAVKSSDGCLWFANGNFIQSVDPSDAAASAPQLPVRIEELFADHNAISLEDPLRLPALTRTVELRYTAVSPGSAQRVKFRYRLDGLDPDWQDAGSRRAAFYNDLGPGQYRFHAIALREDGTWTTDRATLDFVVLPAWYQTTLVRLAALLLGAMAAWQLFAARIRKVRREAEARYDERIQERTRLARDLHDTLLQTIQASKMVVDVALESPEKLEVQHRAVRNVSIWLAQAVDEGRAALHSLRIADDETSDLALALANEVARCNDEGTLKATFSTTGNRWELHPAVQDEVFRIGAEAIKNARAHSRGTNLSVKLDFAKELSLSVSDDGVGIEAALLEAGKPGHFGIAGMRERAARIGAALAIGAVAGGGAAVTLTLSRRSGSIGGQRWWRRIGIRIRRS